VKKASSNSKKSQKKTKPEIGETYKVTLDLVEKGLSIKEVAEKRELVVSTIESHVVKLILENKLPKEHLIDDETEQLIIKAYNENKEATRSMLKGVLPEKITYSQ
jgi:ATP-dependent DNA helicase RecQ